MASTIAKVGAFMADVPLVTPVVTAHGRFTHQRSPVALVVTRDGIEGWGEVDPVPGFSDFSPDDIASEIASRAAAFEGIDIEDRPAWRRRIADLRCGRQAVETAILDALARSLGKSVGALLGTPQRSSIPLTGWIGWNTADEAAAQAASWKARGFAGIKLKVGSGIAVDLTRIEAVREAIGPGLPMIIDAGEAYDADGAIELLNKASRFGVGACEQPVPQKDLEGLARVRSATGVPLILDESVRSVADLDRAVNAGAVDFIKLKLVKHDGLEQAVALGLAAAERGVGCTVGHGFALGLTTLAEGHIASVMPNFRAPGEMVGPLKMAGDIAVPSPDIASGILDLPSGPGLGAAADRSRLAAIVDNE